MARRLLLGLLTVVHIVARPTAPDLVNHPTLVNRPPLITQHEYAMDTDALERFSLETLDQKLDELKEETRKVDGAMKQRRCHKTEVEDQRTRAKRYVTNEYKWMFTNLTWKLRDPFHLFKKEGDFDTVRQTLAHALDMWSRASDGHLRFHDVTDTNTTADMDMFFARWDHGDHEPFDGKGGIVAHSGYPMEGKVHFDASELWTINGKNGIDLRYVTLHELGHALGLRHSQEKGAIMHPIYRRAEHRLALAEDDIAGIRALYHSTGQNV